MKIGLLDHMGFGNLGDAAIQDSVLANIRRRLPNAILVGFSFVPEDTETRHGIPCHPIRWWYPKVKRPESQPAAPIGFKSKLKSAIKSNAVIYKRAKPLADLVHEALFWARSYRSIRNLDLLIISGGGQLCELWDGPWSHPYTVFKFCLLTKLARKRLYFLNVGAGPLKDPLSRFFAKWAVRLADYRSFRDRDSEVLIRSLGVKKELEVFPDPVYALEVENRLKNGSRTASLPVVGLNPIGFCDPRLWPRKDDSIYQKYLEKITRFSVWLLEQGYNLRIFTTEVGVDHYAIEDLRAQLEERFSSPELLRQAFGTPSENVKDLLQEMSQFDFVVTSKFHGIIFSHLLGKPAISLSYHRKMDVAMEAVGQERFCADIEHFDGKWLQEAFSSLVNQGSSIKRKYAAAVETNATKLAQQFDTLFLPSNREKASIVPRPVTYEFEPCTSRPNSRVGE